MQNRAITVRLTEDLSEALRREAFERRVSQASIVIEALRARFGPSGASNVHVTVPVATQGQPYTDPAFRRSLQQAVEEATLRYSGLAGPANALLTVEEAAAELHIARRRVFEMIANGTLPSVKIGKSRRITRAALTEYIRSLEQ